MDIFIGGSKKKYPINPAKDKKEKNEYYEDKPFDDDELPLEWSKIPYPGECEPPIGIDPYAGSWSTYYFRRNKAGVLTTLDGDPVCLDIEAPENINFYKSLVLVKRIQRSLTPKQLQIAEFWGEGPATKQWTPIIDSLIDTYGLSPAYAARVLAAVQAGMNDAFVITWYFKYLWDVPRPIQLDRRLKTAICTPSFPAYPSGHSVISGAAEVILSYFFPPEAERLKELAEENGISRIFGGVHFLEDITEGLKLGRQIGKMVVEELSRQRDIKGSPYDNPPTQDKNAKFSPPPYVQAIPYWPLRVRDCGLPLLPQSK